MGEKSWACRNTLVAFRRGNKSWRNAQHLK